MKGSTPSHVRPTTERAQSDAGIPVELRGRQSQEGASTQASHSQTGGRVEAPAISSDEMQRLIASAAHHLRTWFYAHERGSNDMAPYANTMEIALRLDALVAQLGSTPSAIRPITGEPVMNECKYPKCDWLNREKPACDCDKSPRKYLAAWTAVTYEGHYPPFVNVTQVGSMVRVSVRGPTKANGNQGDCVSFDVNAWTFAELAKALTEASGKFDVNNDPPLARGLSVPV